MGDFEEDNVVESANYNPNTRLKSSIVLLLGLFAPIMMTVSTWGMYPDISLQSLFWMYYPASSYYSGFTLIPPFALFSMFPLVLLRMVPVFMIYRYYNEKTTRRRALIGTLIGDGIFSVLALPNVILSFMFGFGFLMIPLPIQMIAGAIILWRSPIPEPTTPWEGMTESKSWWEKSPEAQRQMKLDDDDDVLW